MDAELLRDSLGRRIPSRVRHYTDAEKAEAVALAATIGSDAASDRLGIPRRNLSRWRREPPPAVQAAIVTTRETIAARLLEALDVGTSAVLAGLRDPKARLGDKANALRVVVELARLEGTAPRDVYQVDNSPEAIAKRGQEARDETAFLRTIVDMPPDELRAYLATEKGAELVEYIADTETRPGRLWNEAVDR